MKRKLITFGEYDTYTVDGLIETEDDVSINDLFTEFENEIFAKLGPRPILTYPDVGGNEERRQWNIKFHELFREKYGTTDVSEAFFKFLEQKHNLHRLDVDEVNLPDYLRDP